MIKTSVLKHSTSDLDVVLPKDRDRVLAIIEENTQKQSPAMRVGFCDEVALSTALKVEGLTYVVDNMNLSEAA